MISPDVPRGTAWPAPSSVVWKSQPLSEDVLRAAGLITDGTLTVWPGWSNVVFFAVPDGTEAAALQTVRSVEDGPAKVLTAYALGGRRAVEDLIAGWAAQGGTHG